MDKKIIILFASYWEENLGDQQIPDGSMDKWIKAKYEQKKWVKNEEVPNPSDIKITENQPNVKNIYGVQ